LGGGGCDRRYGIHAVIGCGPPPGGGPVPPHPNAPRAVATHAEQCGTDDEAAAQVAARVAGALPLGVSGPPDPIRTPEGNDWRSVEFGAGIVRNSDGRYGASFHSIYSNNLPSFVAVSFPIGAQIQGLWHSHPIRSGALQQSLDRYPSSYDWNSLAGIAATPGASTDPSLWITGPDGITREFKYSERQYYESLSDPQMQSGHGLTGKERTNTC
jgi:hypothetical protein